MKVRTLTSAVIAFASMSVIAIPITSSNARTFGMEPGSPNGTIQTQKPGWLDGSGKDLRIKIAGRVFDENDTPAKDFKLEACLKTNAGERGLPAAIDGNRFEFWVPVRGAGGANWFTLCVNATSADGRQIVRRMILNYEIRQTAIDGLTLRMKRPERSVQVTVVKNGRARARLRSWPWNSRATPHRPDERRGHCHVPIDESRPTVATDGLDERLQDRRLRIGSSSAARSDGRQIHD